MFFGHNLARSTNWSVLSDGVAAGTGDTQTTSVIDTAEDRGVVGVLVLGTVATGGAGIFKAQMSMDNGVSDPFTDVAGSGFTFSSANTGQAMVLDLYRPQKRYIQFVTLRTGSGNTTIQSVVAQTYHLGVSPEAPGTNIANVAWLSNAGPGAA